MREALKRQRLIVLWFAGILFTSSTSIFFAEAQPIPTSLTLAILSPPTEKACTIGAILQDENGAPLPNMEIRFLFCGSSLISANKTDAQGVASLTLSDELPLATTPDLTLNYPELNLLKRTETWDIQADFSGTPNYASSRSEYLCITFVFRNYTPYLIGLSILVGVLSIAGYIVFRRRKTALNIPKMAKDG